MSKSKGNFYILKDIVEKGFLPKAIRYLLMGTHYRQKLNFTLNSLEASNNALKRFKEFLLKLNSVNGDIENPKTQVLIEKARIKFTEAMDDDLNISEALAAVFDFMGEINKLMAESKLSGNDAKKAILFLEELDSVLGILDLSISIEARFKIDLNSFDLSSSSFT